MSKPTGYLTTRNWWSAKPPAQVKLFEDTAPQQGPPVYRADQASDGTWTIFDVPVFAAHSEERGDRTLAFDAGWLAGALKQGATREAEGYMPPLHVSHHDGAPVEAAGKFRLTRVGKIPHGGEEVDALFADLVGVRPEVYERIRKGELSYRSVEILDVSADPEIDSLALLDDEVPFFRFPLLRVAEGTQPIMRKASAGPAKFYSAAGKASAALFRFEEKTMTEPTTGKAPAADPTKKTAGDPLAILQQVMSALSQLGQALQQGGGNTGPEQPTQGPGPVEQPQPAMQQGMSPPQQPQPMHPQPVAVGASQRAFEAKGAEDGMRAMIASLQGEVRLLKQARAVDAKATELVGAGFKAEQVTEFRATATKHGLEAATHYAAGLQRNGAPSEPPTHWSGEIRGEAPDTPEVAAYAEAGPETLASARGMYASWQRSGSEVPFKDFFEANQDADAFLGVRK